MIKLFRNIRKNLLAEGKTSKYIKYAIGEVILVLIGILMCLNCQNEERQLPDPLEAGWKGQKVAEVIEDNSQVRILKCTFPPGVGHEKHYHKPHTGYTIAGSTFRITDQNGTRDVKVPSGYSFSNDETTIHEVLNIGDSTAVFLIIEPKTD